MSDLLKEVLLCILILSILVAIGVYYGESKSYTVWCVIITQAGAVKTVEFEDESVKEESGVIKGKTKVYRLNVNEACLITEKSK